jgi:hypothetical protein
VQGDEADQAMPAMRRVERPAKKTDAQPPANKARAAREPGRRQGRTCPLP